MSIIAYIIVGYLVGSVLVALHLGWHLSFKLDRFDWRYGKTDIWTSFFLKSFLWPVLLLFIRNPFSSKDLYDDTFGFIARAREEARLRGTPPPCGGRIRYIQGHARYDETFGEFTFQTKDVLDVLSRRLKSNPNLVNDQEGAMLEWVRRADNSITEPTAVPGVWWRFQYLADELIRMGLVEVRCLRCDAQVPNDRLLTSDDSDQDGWNFDRLVCLRGHPLLIVEAFHVLTTPSRDTEEEIDVR